MNKNILRLAIPNIISNLSVPLLGVVDTAVVGHLDHIYYLGAIAVGGVIFDFIFWGFGFLRMGTTGLTAQAHGAGNDREVHIILRRVLLVAVSISVVILLTQYLILDLSLLIVNASKEVEEFTRAYFFIRIYSAPATLALFGLNGWFLGMQNSTYPMIVTIVLNVLNIILNLILVLGFEMNVSGVALGTLISNYIAVTLALILYKKRYGGEKYFISLNDLIDPHELKRFFSVNRDIFIRTVCLIFSYAFFMAKSAESGNVVLAANTILLQLWHISAYGVDGFAFAAESLVGKYKGANKNDKLAEAIKKSFAWGLGIGIAGTLIYGILGEQMIALFTDKELVVTAAGTVIIWTIFAPVVNSVCFVWDGVFIGATETGTMRNTMLFATILCFLPAYYFTKDSLGVHALWLAMTAFMVARGVALSVMAPSKILLSNS